MVIEPNDEGTSVEAVPGETNRGVLLALYSSNARARSGSGRHTRCMRTQRPIYRREFESMPIKNESPLPLY